MKYSKEKLKAEKERIGLGNFIKKSLFFSLSIFPFCNSAICSNMWKESCIKHLYRYISDEYELKIIEPLKKMDKKVIWVMWLQGKENMPPLVKKCFESLEQYKGEYQIILLDENYEETKKLIEEVRKYE